MSSNFNILISIDSKTDSEFVSQCAAKKFPSARITLAGKNDSEELLLKNEFHIIIIDCSPPDDNSLLDIFSRLSCCSFPVQIILLIPEGRQELINTAIENDIPFYLTIPIKEHELGLVLERTGHKADHLLQKKSTDTPQEGGGRFPGFIGECRVMQNLFQLISRIAEDDYSTVLIRGESGTGKELVARAIHSNSRRKNHNFVPVNCAAIPDDLLESELFGHIKGAFTGATQTKQGRIQYADKGTLFLDEIGDMKPALQAKLLRVLQEKEFEPVGSLKPVPVDTRILAATHCDLEEQVKAGNFREDLYYRISVIPLEVPPLRDRVSDIPILLRNFIHSYTTKRGREKINFTPSAIEALMECEWRGNVRELENLVQHMSILYSGTNIHPHDLPEKYISKSTSFSINQDSVNERTPVSMYDCSREKAELFSTPPSFTPEVDFSNGPIDFNHLINEFEKDLIIKAMKLTSGNKKEAARILTLKRTTLLEKIKKKDLNGSW